MGACPMNEIIEKIKRRVRLGKIIYLKLKRLYNKVERSYLKFERSYLKDKSERAILKFLLRGIVVLFALLILVMLFPPIEFVFNYLTGEKSKLEFIKIIGWGMSGLIAIFGVIGLLQRAAALDEQNKIIRDGQRDERMKTANERLASKDTLVRIASFNDFYYLASIEPDLRRHILNILCEHLQQITKDKNNRDDIRMQEKIRPTNEEQRLLDILFKNDSVFDNLYANLAEINLQNANLQNAELEGANLQKSNMQYADLQEANLQEANLQGANLQGAYLREANLRETNLTEADMQGAKLQNAKMQYVELLGASLDNANLQGANLQYATITNMPKADLQNAKLQNAFLYLADLQEANLQSANLQGANLQEANLQGANLQNAKLQDATINKETIMPDGWEDMVERNDDGKTGVLLVDNKEKVIKQL